MSKIKIIIILFSFLCINCQKKTLQNDSKIENSDTYDENKYKEVNFQVKKLNDSDNNTEMYTFHHYKLVLNSETEKSEIIFNNNSYPINLNFTYDTDVNDALRNIRIFENNKGNEIILIPSFGSNDEITYQVILLKNKILYENVISYSLLSDFSTSKKIEIYEKKGYFNIKVGKVSIKTEFTKQMASPQKVSLSVKEKNLEISLAEKKIILKNTIINEMSLSTSFAPIGDKEFYVMYENNASMTKTVEIYKFLYDTNNLKLSSKEVLKFGQEGISDNLFLYDNKLIDTSYDYEKLNSLESTTEDSFTKSPIRKNIFKNSKKIESKGYKNISPEDYFVDKSTFK